MGERRGRRSFGMEVCTLQFSTCNDNRRSIRMASRPHWHMPTTYVGIDKPVSPDLTEILVRGNIQPSCHHLSITIIIPIIISLACLMPTYIGAQGVCLSRVYIVYFNTRLQLGQTQISETCRNGARSFYGASLTGSTELHDYLGTCHQIGLTRFPETEAALVVSLTVYLPSFPVGQPNACLM